MAGAGFKTFATGEVLTASDVNTYLMQQTVMVFADSTARSTALGANVAQGMLSFLKSDNTLYAYNGSAWVTPVAGDISGVTAGTALTGGGTSGDVTLNYDLANYGNAKFVAGRNKFINGDFSINQRAFSSTGTTGTYGFDRWLMEFANGTCTYSAQTFTTGTAPVTGYEGKNFARIVTASQSTASSFCALEQKIESARTFAGQTVTFSFWAKASTGTPNVGVSIEQAFGTGGSPSNSVITSPAVQAITSSWARYSFTISVPSISGKTFGTNNDDCIRSWIFTSSGTSISGLGYAATGVQNATIDIWGVQLEAGSVATPFTTATGTIQGELAACQRYYEKSYDQATAPAANTGTTGNGCFRKSPDATVSYMSFGTIIFQTAKRTAPTITCYNPVTGSSATPARNDTGTINAGIDRDAIGQHSFHANISNVSVGTGTVMAFHFIAEAEL